MDLGLNASWQCFSWIISFVSAPPPPPPFSLPLHPFLASLRSPSPLGGTRGAHAQIIGTAIPQVQTIQALVGAAFLLQFSYTLPPIMQFAFDVQADASKGDGVYAPGVGPQRADTWKDWSRWKRGLGTGRVVWKWANFVYFLASLATCALGIWGSVSAARLPPEGRSLLLTRGSDGKGGRSLIP